VNIEFIELELDWPYGLSLYDLKEYILSNLINHGEPLRWAITSLTTYSEKNIQKISIEAVLLVQNDKTKDSYTNLN
tara:strand:+ start:281 stop:508 length:228 start_codon:yes stop_codon:yes gene_type:complete